MTQEKTLAQFIEEHGITIEPTFIGLESSENWERFKWSVVLRCGKRADTFEYSMGLAHQTWNDTAKPGIIPHARPGKPVELGASGRNASSEALAVWHRRGYTDPTPPSAEELLDSLCLDAGSIEDSTTFEEWAGEFGYDTDSRKAEATFRACQAGREKLLKLLGKAAYEDLAANVERL